MSHALMRRACACLLALLLAPTAGFATALAATGSTASHAVAAKKKRPKARAVCAKRAHRARKSRAARVRAHKSSLLPSTSTPTVSVPPLPPLPLVGSGSGSGSGSGGGTTGSGGSTGSGGGTTTGSGGGTTTGSGGGTTTSGGGGTTTTSGGGGTTTSGGGGTTSGSGTHTAGTTTQSGSTANGTSPSTQQRPATKAKTKKRHHKKVRRHKKRRHAKKRHAKKHVVKKHVTKKRVVKKHKPVQKKKKVVHKKKAAPKKKAVHKKRAVHKKKSLHKKKKTTKKRTTNQPAAQAPAQPNALPCAPPSPTGFTVGMVSGPAVGWEANMTYPANLHPKSVRVPIELGSSVQDVESQVAALAAKGEQALILADFHGFIPSTQQAQSLASWAHAVGPGGTMWQGRSDGYLAPRYIEFGNETNQGYQFGGVSSGPSYVQRAQNYALRAKDAQQAIDSPAGNPNVGLLVIGDQGGCGCSQWMDGMFSAVPDLNRRIAGWTVHPYGPKSRYSSIMQQLVADTAKHGDHSLPFFATEYGIATDNGRCLSDNYGWPTCLTYQQAGDDLASTINDLHQTYGSRLAAFYIYEQRDLSASGSSSNRESYFGAIQSNGGQKGAYTAAIRNLLNTYRG